MTAAAAGTSMRAGRLAKTQSDPDGKFPACAPLCVKEMLENRRRFQQEFGWNLNAEMEMLERLLRHEKMQAVWKFLEAAERPKTWLKGVEHSEIFAGAALRGFMGPVGDERHTRKEFEIWTADVKKAATKLSRLIVGTELDKYLGRRHSKIWPYAESNIFVEMRFSEVLDAFTKCAEWGVASLKPVPLKCLRGAKAQRVYFMRTLSAYFKKYFGYTHNVMVDAATVAAFDEPTSVLRQVQRNVEDKNAPAAAKDPIDLKPEPCVADLPWKVSTARSGRKERTKGNTKSRKKRIS